MYILEIKWEVKKTNHAEGCVRRIHSRSTRGWTDSKNGSIPLLVCTATYNSYILFHGCNSNLFWSSSFCPDHQITAPTFIRNVNRVHIFQISKQNLKKASSKVFVREVLSLNVLRKGNTKCFSNFKYT